MQFLLISLAAILIITPLLYSLSKDLRSMSSFKDELERYEEIPDTRSITRRFLLGWEWKMQRKMHHLLIDALGDKFVTFFFHLSGYFFLLLLVVVWVLFGLFIASTIAA